MPDEAQYWTWSLFPDIGYYSKPPGIAWQIAAGTALFGHTALGVRFLALLLPIASALVIRAIVKQLTGQNGWLAAIAFILSPLGMTGAFLATTDSGMVFFWLLATYWYIRLEGHPFRFFIVAFFIATGAWWKWMAYSFWIVVVADCLKKRSKDFLPLLAAIALSGIGLLPALLWNWQHSWAGFHHVGSTIFDHHTSHAPANPVQFFLAGIALITPGFFVLALPAFKEKDARSKFLVLSVFVIWGGLLLLSLFRKVQGNWAIVAQTLFFPLLGVVLYQRPTWKRWPYQAALVLALCCQLLVLATPYLGSLAICPFKQGLGCNFAASLQQAGYLPSKDFLFSDRYQTTSQLWFCGPQQLKTYFFNLNGLRHNQFNYWPGMQHECQGKRGFFVSVVPISEEKGLKARLHRYREELAPYFLYVAKPQTYTLYSAWGVPVRSMIVILCDGYNGQVPEEIGKF
jgi:4-amino-4-deoxy-L-arabinose transferase-like glycosyltransferase